MVRSLSKTTLLAAVSAFLMCGCGASQNSAPPLTWLRASGQKIVNQRGQTVRLTGFNDPRMFPGAGNSPDACGRLWKAPKPTLARDVAAWGFNSVRLDISWSDLEPTPPTVGKNGSLTHHWNEKYLSALDSVVHALASHHVYVILNMDQGALSPAFRYVDYAGCEGNGMPAWLFPGAANQSVLQGWCAFLGNYSQPGVPIRPLDGLADAWRTVAARYAADPAVAGMDLINEPGGPYAGDIGGGFCAQTSYPLKATYMDYLDRRVGDAIRRVDPHVMLFLEDDWGRIGVPHTILSTGGLTNVVYEYHLYAPSWRVGEASLRSAGGFASHLGVPLWIGEFTAFGGDLNPRLDARAAVRNLDPSWRTDTAALLRYTRTKGIGWSLEAYSGVGSILKPWTDTPKPRLLAILRAGLAR